MEGYKYCPYCKSDLKEETDLYICPFCKKKIYKHSSITASIFALKDNKVLLSKRAIEPHKGKYDVIGGFLKYGEDPMGGAIRETVEETGAYPTNLLLLGIYMDRYEYQNFTFPTLNFVYTATLEGKIKASDDVESLEWFPLNCLPEVAFESMNRALKDLQKK